MRGSIDDSSHESDYDNDNHNNSGGDSGDSVLFTMVQNDLSLRPKFDI